MKYAHIRRLVTLILAIVFLCGYNIYVRHAHSQKLLIEQTRPVPAANQDNSGRSGRNGDIIATYGNWRVVCQFANRNSSAQSCGISTSSVRKIGDIITDPNFSLSGQFIRQSKKKSLVPLFFFRVPFDLLLPMGLDIKIDKKTKFKLAIRSCHIGRGTNGCLAPFKLSDSMVRALTKGKILEISARSVKGHNEIRYFSLEGFTKSLTHLRRRGISK